MCKHMYTNIYMHMYTYTHTPKTTKVLFVVNIQPLAKTN